MPQMTPFHCPKCSCRKKFTSDSWRCNHIKLPHPEHFQVARQKNLTIHSAPWHVEPGQHREFNCIIDQVNNLDTFPYLGQVKNIPDSESQPLAPPLSQTETYPGAGAPLCDYISDPWEWHAQGCLETILQNDLYYPSATCEEYRDVQSGIEKKGMEPYYENMRTEKNTALHFWSFKNWDGIQNLMASMPDDQALGEWELHTFEDLTRNDNHQLPIKYWSWDIIKSMRWLMR